MKEKPVEPLIQPITPRVDVGEKKKKQMVILGAAAGFIIVAGVLTGYFLSRSSSSASGGGSLLTGGKTMFGSSDTKTFSDTAVGVIEKDGISGEGTHKLIREGGPSQTACLVSSVLDLDEFVGKKVKVWSKTNDAKQCPWFMDVGKIELQ